MISTSVLNIPHCTAHPLVYCTDIMQGESRAALVQPPSQHCLSTGLAQAVSFSTLIGCYLNDESVRKVLKTQVQYQISNDLQLQSMKEAELQSTRKQLLDNEMVNLH